MRIRHEHKVAVADAGWKMVDLGLTTGLDSGDVTLFDREEGVIYALPAPSARMPIRSWKDVRPEDIAIVTPDGTVLPESMTEPTVELPMHLSTIRSRLDANAIVHTHAEILKSLQPPSATSRLRLSIPTPARDSARIDAGSSA